MDQLPWPFYNNNEGITVDNFTELGQLIKSTLQTVDELFPPKPEVSFEDMMVQFYTLKSKIKKIDPSWKFENTDISYVFEILKLLDWERGELPIILV